MPSSCETKNVFHFQDNILQLKGKKNTTKVYLIYLKQSRALPGACQLLLYTSALRLLEQLSYWRQYLYSYEPG
jgi:hypothetical protein